MFHFRLENSFKHTTTTVYAALFYDLPTPVCVYYEAGTELTELRLIPRSLYTFL